MTDREDILKLAREAGLHLYVNKLTEEPYAQIVERFAALVAAAEREKYKWDVHSCGPTCQRYVCVAMREAVEAEREACAKIAEGIGREMAEAIRARGEK